MTDPTILAGAAVIVIGALAAGIVAIINAIAKMKRDLLDGVREVKAVADTTAVKVDGAASAAAAANAELQRLNESLRRQLADQRQVASLLAQEKVTVPAKEGP